MKMPFWKLFVLAAFPVVAALATGAWLSGRIQKSSHAETQRIRTEEVVAQDRLLVDAIWSAIETIKTRALSLNQVREAQLRSGVPAAAPEGVILHWAELEVRDGNVHAIRQKARNPAWNPGQDSSGHWEAFEQFYLQSAMQRLNLHELQENGVAVLRLKQDPHRNQEWLALAFAGSHPASVILTLVDPVEVFPVFKRWTQRSEGGSLRGYLVGTDGFVLAHSQGHYVASNFGRTQVFELGVREMLHGRTLSGAGIMKSIDEMPVTVAYSRPGTLPIAVVVERMTTRSEAASVLASAPRELFEALLFLSAISLLYAWGIRRAFRAMQPGGAPFVEALVQASRVAEPSFENVQPVLSAPPLRSDRVKIAQFETQSQRTQDARLVASHLAQIASELTGSPALFFAYQERVRAAILQAQSGFEKEVESMSFPVNEATVRQASFSEDAGLLLLLSKRLGTRQCDAWPVSGGEGRLLGVLVVLKPGALENRTDQLEQLGKITKVSGPVYERIREGMNDV